MVEFEKKRGAQNKEDAQERQGVQKKGSKVKEKTICSRTIYLDKDTMCNRTPPTPARSISPDRNLIPSPLSSLSSNSRAVYYGDTAATVCMARRTNVSTTKKKK